MNEFFAVLLSYPAFLLSLLLILLLIFWVLVTIGLLDSHSVDELSMLGYFANFAGGLTSIVLSLWLFSAWLLIMPLSYFVIKPLPSPLWQGILGTLFLLASLWLGLRAVRWLMRPLRPLFRDSSARGGAALRGRVCVISTARVDEEFGQANYDDQGAGLILPIRATSPNTLKRGDKALIIEYDSGQGVYWVAAHWD
jgi:hypothetical protein